MDAKTKNILVKGAIGIAVFAVSVLTVRMVIKKVRESRADRDRKNDKDETVPYDPATQFKLVKLGQSGYVNVRNTPFVPETMNYADWLLTPWEYFQDKTKSNLIGKVTTSPVGFVSKEEKGPDGYLWYRIQLAKPIGEAKYGWVREDAVIIEIKNK